ncbi:MAG: hypothetical protein ACE5E7_15090 [Anaerolineae bacterium]
MASNSRFTQIAGGATSQGGNLLKESVHRVLGMPELALYFTGVRPLKWLRLQVVILRNEAGTPLAQESELAASLKEAARVFEQEAGVRIIPAGALVTTLPTPAPTAALDVHCETAAWREDFSECGAHFRKALANHTAGKLFGYGAPVTVFIVRSIFRKGGCSLGPLADYVTVEAGVLNRGSRRLLAHEVAHACGLFHSRDKTNLMFPIGPGERLKRWQAAVLRNSRHVTYV